jgi:hypothetical protein
MRLWTSEERDRVPQWFRARKHLPQEEVLAQFEQDFGYRRTFSAIQTASYYRAKRKSYRSSRKRKRTLPRNNISARPTIIEPAPVTEPCDITQRPLATDSAAAASVSFLDALRSFPRDIPSSENSLSAISSAESLQTAHTEAQVSSNTTEGTSWNARSSFCACESKTGSPGQAGPVVSCPIHGEAAKGNTLSGNGCQSTHLGSADDRGGNGPSDTNQRVCEVGTPASFRPVNLWSRSGSGVVGLRAQASRPVAHHHGRLRTL